MPRTGRIQAGMLARYFPDESPFLPIPLSRRQDPFAVLQDTPGSSGLSEGRLIAEQRKPKDVTPNRGTLLRVAQCSLSALDSRSHLREEVSLRNRSGFSHENRQSTYVSLSYLDRSLNHITDRMSMLLPFKFQMNRFILLSPRLRFGALSFK